MVQAHVQHMTVGRNAPCTAQVCTGDDRLELSSSRKDAAACMCLAADSCERKLCGWAQAGGMLPVPVSHSWYQLPPTAPAASLLWLPWQLPPTWAKRTHKSYCTFEYCYFSLSSQAPSGHCWLHSDTADCCSPWIETAPEYCWLHAECGCHASCLVSRLSLGDRQFKCLPLQAQV